MCAFDPPPLNINIMPSDKLHDNGGIEYTIDVEADCQVALEGFVIQAFKDKPVTHYKIEKNVLYLDTSYQADERGYHQLPFPLNHENAFFFIENWLYNVPRDLVEGNGQQLGFHAELRSFGDYKVKVSAIWIYYGK